LPEGRNPKNDGRIIRENDVSVGWATTNRAHTTERGQGAKGSQGRYQKGLGPSRGAI
jgi:hypothetical protein